MNVTHPIPPALRVLGWIHLLIGAAGLVAGSLLCVGLALYDDPRRAAALGFVGWVFGTLALTWLFPAAIGGAGLLRGRRWARVPIAIVSVVILPGFPLGTILGGFGLWALLRYPFPTEDGAEAAASPSASFWTPGPVGDLLLMMAGVGAAFIVLLWAGFALSGDAMPVPIEQAHGTALAVLCVTIAYGIWRILPGPRAQAARQRYDRGTRAELLARQAAWQKQKREMLAHIANDPLRAAYAARIEAGESWTLAQIDYDLDPHASTTCAHLAPIERAMRMAGVLVKLHYGNTISADCVVEEPAARERFAVEPPVGFGYLPQSGRDYEDPPSVAFTCSEHRARIYVMDPQAAPPGALRFP